MFITDLKQSSGVRHLVMAFLPDGLLRERLMEALTPTQYGSIEALAPHHRMPRVRVERTLAQQVPGSYPSSVLRTPMDS